MFLKHFFVLKRQFSSVILFTTFKTSVLLHTLSLLLVALYLFEIIFFMTLFDFLDSLSDLTPEAKRRGQNKACLNLKDTL